MLGGIANRSAERSLLSPTDFHATSKKKNSFPPAAGRSSSKKLISIRLSAVTLIARLHASAMPQLFHEK
jgi:hypothetical protein